MMKYKISKKECNCNICNRLISVEMYDEYGGIIQHTEPAAGWFKVYRGEDGMRGSDFDICSKQCLSKFYDDFIDNFINNFPEGYLSIQKKTSISN